MRCTALILLALVCSALICGLAGAETYDSGSGIDNITSDNCSTWSTRLSNNDSTVTCNINVKGGVLNLINATIRMDGNSIWVRNGATMNVTDGSTITWHDSSYYNFNYESGSYGKLNDSTVEYSSKLQIATENNITITNCTIRNNQEHGIHLTSTSGYVNITDCRINNTVNRGIFIESSQGNILRSNSLNNNSRDYSLYATGDYDQDIDISNTVNGGRVYYNHSDSGTITNDANIGHITIADCTDLWFAGCTIHNGDGVRIVGSSSSGISRSTIENNAKQGVCFTDSSNNLINDSYILDNDKNGIDSAGSSDYNRIINNSITGNTAGIHLTGAGHNSITDNTVSSNRGNGIRLGDYTEHSSTDNILHNNTIQSNDVSGISFCTNYNRLSENKISGNSDLALRLSCGESKYYYNYIWRNNTANGEQVNYYYDEHAPIIIENHHLSETDVSDVGKITLVDCTGIVIKDNILSNNTKGGFGILLWNSSGNNLTNNIISNNRDGIRLYKSSGNEITTLRMVYPNLQYGAHIGSDSDYNSITRSTIASMNAWGLYIDLSDHTTITDTTIYSMSGDGAYVIGSHTNFTNATITSDGADGLCTRRNYTIIAESNITAYGTGVNCIGANHISITDTTVKAGTDGIYMSQSHWGNLTNNTIDAKGKGICLTTSRDHNLTVNRITNYKTIGILLEEYSTNTTMIGNDLTRNGAEFDIRINDSNGATIANNKSTATNYTFYLTDDTRLATLDTVFNKTKVGYGDALSNLTLMWRIDVLCWDNYHQEWVWANLTVRYGDYSDAGSAAVWGEGEKAITGFRS
jgi:parallel beta-helix repeat protein